MTLQHAPKPTVEDRAPRLIRADEVPESWGRSHAELPILLSAIRRHELGVRFDAARGRFETIDEGRERQAAGGGA